MTKKKKWLLVLAAVLVAAAAATAGRSILKKEGTALKEAYVLEQVCSFPGQKAWKTEVREGDVIREGWCDFSRIPASRDRVKAVETEKVRNLPYDPPDRLLRIKELREDGAVVAVLHQYISYQDDMRVIEEYESLLSVGLGQIFSVYVKQPLLDAPSQPMHDFVIYRKDDPIEPWRPAPPEPVSWPILGSGGANHTGSLSCCCDQCGFTARYDDAAKPPRFCPECGNPF